MLVYRNQRIFFVKSCYDHLQPQKELTFPWKAYFVWTALKGRILTLDNIQRRVISLPNICLFCHNVLESIDHIFLHCPFACELWSMFLFEVDLKWVFLTCIKDLFEQWCFFGRGCKGDRLWKMWISAI